MTSKTKIVVLQLKKLVYTGIFITLGILLLILFLIMINPKDDTDAASTDPIYTPGTYSTSLVLNNTSLSVAVTVSENAITSISMENMDESIAVMYPLMEPALDSLAAQIIKTQSLENITYPEDQKYTSLVLLNAISGALEQASIEKTGVE